MIVILLLLKLIFKNNAIFWPWLTGYFIIIIDYWHNGWMYQNEITQQEEIQSPITQIWNNFLLRSFNNQFYFEKKKNRTFLL